MKSYKVQDAKIKCWDKIKEANSTLDRTLQEDPMINKNVASVKEIMGFKIN